MNTSQFLTEHDNDIALPISFSHLTNVPQRKKNARSPFFYIEKLQGYCARESFYKPYSKVIKGENNG